MPGARAVASPKHSVCLVEELPERDERIPEAPWESARLRRSSSSCSIQGVPCLLVVEQASHPRHPACSDPSMTRAIPISAGSSSHLSNAHQLMQRHHERVKAGQEADGADARSPAGPTTQSPRIREGQVGGHGGCEPSRAEPSQPKARLRRAKLA